MPYVYILKSLRDGRYYVGSTKNLHNRIVHHQKGFTPSTKKFGGVKLVFKQEYDSLTKARSIEKKLKKLKRRDYLEKIINDGIIRMSV